VRGSATTDFLNIWQNQIFKFMSKRRCMTTVFSPGTKPHISTPYYLGSQF